MPARKKSVKLLRCPTCKALVRREDEDFPFCSDRCRKIDLGKWASGAYKISSPVLDPDVLEDLGGAGMDRSAGSGGSDES
ncbi:MAG: DNA gyrase inhibitor YacG [Terracidiphilus sp.]